MKNRADDRRQDGKRKQSPGSPARGDSRPTAPDAAAQRPYQRRELVAILEEYGVSVAVFEGLRVMRMRSIWRDGRWPGWKRSTIHC